MSNSPKGSSPAATARGNATTPVLSAGDQRHVWRVTIGLLLAQSLSATAYNTTATINSLAFVDITHMKALAGIPGFLVLVGGALTGYIAGLIMSRYGRRTGLVLAGLVGAVGAALGAAGLAMQSLLLYMPGLLLLGAGRGALDQSRYAAAEVHPPERRARTISIVLWGATVGAVAGQALLVPSSAWADHIGITTYAGPMVSTAVLYVVTSVMIFALLAFNLPALVKKVAIAYPSPIADSPSQTTERSFREAMQNRNALAAVAAMVCGQAAMVLVMGMAALHMKDHQHSLEDISLVMAVHVLGMFAFSPLVGQLADRMGKTQTIVLGTFVLGLGAILAPFSLATIWLAFAQFLVGLGWSMMFVSGSALLTDALGLAERARLQGASDTCVQVGAAAGSLSGGLLLATVGFPVLSLIGLIVALTPLLFVARAGGLPKRVPRAV